MRVKKGGDNMRDDRTYTTDYMSTSPKGQIGE